MPSRWDRRCIATVFGFRTRVHRVVSCVLRLVCGPARGNGAVRASTDKDDDGEATMTKY